MTEPWSRRTHRAGRAALREATLDALAAAIAAGDPGVSMAALARQVGASRQTLYAELGSREALVVALAERENAALLAQVVAELDAYGDDLVAAVGAAAELALTLAADDVINKALLAGGPAADAALGVGTVARGEPLLHQARDVLGGFVLERFPMLDPEDTRLLVEVVLRLVQSHILWPQEPAAVTAGRVRRLVERYLAGGPDGPDRDIRKTPVQITAQMTAQITAQAPVLPAPRPPEEAP